MAVHAFYHVQQDHSYYQFVHTPEIPKDPRCFRDCTAALFSGWSSTEEGSCTKASSPVYQTHFAFRVV